MFGAKAVTKNRANDWDAAHYRIKPKFMAFKWNCAAAAHSTVHRTEAERALVRNSHTCDKKR